MFLFSRIQFWCGPFNPCMVGLVLVWTGDTCCGEWITGVVSRVRVCKVQFWCGQICWDWTNSSVIGRIVTVISQPERRLQVFPSHLLLQLYI